MMIVTALVFLLLLSVLVLIHEAGHYFVAKKLGIKVEEFGFGLPPRLWGKKKGETIYSINWLPIGGFVKLYGEDEAGAGRIGVKSKEETKKGDERRAFFARPAWQRVSVVIAGVVMNTLLAVFIYYVFLLLSGFQAELPLWKGKAYQFFGANQKTVTQVIVTEVTKDSPAAAAGITANSRIVSFDGQAIENQKSFLEMVQANKGKPVHLAWEDLNTHKRSEAVLTPRINPPKGQGSLGVAFFPFDTIMLSYDTPLQKAWSGFVHPANLMVYNVVVLKDLFNDSVKEKTVEPLSQGVSGPVGIFNLVGALVSIPDIKERVLQILNLAGLLSMSLAFFNVLPIPGLDGGRLFFIVIEMVSGRKVNQKFEGYAHAVGMALLIGLILWVTVKDILQLFPH